jgi:hypothetical protein
MRRRFHLVLTPANQHAPATIKVIGKAGIDSHAAESHCRGTLVSQPILQWIKARPCLSCHFR